MSDSEEKRRPNANYRLSHENADTEEIVYHYNREQRLEKAPQLVRDLYNEEPKRRGGIFRSLTNTKPKAMTFISIVIMCLAIFVLSVLGYTSDSHDFDGNLLTVQAIKFEGAVIVALKKTIKKNIVGRRVTAYTGAVNIAVTAPDVPLEDVFYHRVFFSLEPEEQYRFSVPFDSDYLMFILQTEKKTLNVKVKPQ